MRLNDYRDLSAGSPVTKTTRVQRCGLHEPLPGPSTMNKVCRGVLELRLGLFTLSEGGKRWKGETEGF